MAAAEKLVAAIGAGGAAAVSVVVVILLVGMLFASPLGMLEEQIPQKEQRLAQLQAREANVDAFIEKAKQYILACSDSVNTLYERQNRRSCHVK